MIGASCVVVANLKPSDLRGVTSQGMVLAAKSADGYGKREGIRMQSACRAHARAHTI